MNSDPLSRILEALPDHKRAGKGVLARCPAHEDRQASLSVSEGHDGKVLLRCHAGCPTEAIVAALGLDMRDLFATPGTAPRAPRTIAAVYPYRDEAGALLFEAVRFTPKGFAQRRPNGAGGYHYNLDGVRRVVYRLPELQRQRNVILPEGEKDADRLAALGLPATTSPAGAGKWRPEYAEQLVAAGAQRIAILPDNDAAGDAHARDVARSCLAAGLTVSVVRLDGLPPKGDVSDWLDMPGHDAEGLRAALNAAPVLAADDPWLAAPTEPQHASRATQTAPLTHAVAVRLSDVVAKRVSWVWGRRLARGKLTLVVGDPGVTKSAFWIDTLARVSCGALFPDGERAPLGTSIILTAEDALDDTIKPRFLAAGGDPSRIVAVQGVAGAGEPDAAARLLALDRDVATLERLITEEQAAIVVIDPIGAYFPPKMESKTDTHVRAVLSPLVAMAERTGAAILAVMHLTKDDSRKVLHRVLGSIGFVGQARIVLAVAPDPDDPSRRLLLPVKSNFQDAAPLAYRPVGVTVDTDGGPCETFALTWEAVTTAPTADAVFAASADDATDRDDAETFLTGLLAQGDPVPSADIFRQARAHGISERTLKRAKTKLGVRAKLVGFGREGKWHWWLPLSGQTERATQSAYPEVAPSDPLCTSLVVTERAIQPETYTRSSRGPLSNSLGNTQRGSREGHFEACQHAITPEDDDAIRL